MDKIEQRLYNLYKNLHAEYGSTTTVEERDEIKSPNIESYIIYHSNQA